MNIPIAPTPIPKNGGTPKPDNPAESVSNCRYVDMRTFYHVLGDVLHHGPPPSLERLSPWIIAVLGTAMLALMTYCWWTG